MRTFIRGSILLITMGIISGRGASAEPRPAAQPDKVAETKNCVMQSGGTDVLRLTTSADTKCVAKDGTLHIKAPEYDFEVWVVSGAQTVDDAIKSVDKQIVDEFKDFKPATTTDLTVAGSPAKRLVGKGHEADDGDPGAADVIVFKVADHVFVACTHGESLAVGAQQGLLALVQTAQKP